MSCGQSEKRAITQAPSLQSWLRWKAAPLLCMPPDTLPMLPLCCNSRVCIFLLNQMPKLEASPVNRSNWAFLQELHIPPPICSVVLSQVLPWPNCADPGKGANQTPFSLPNDFPMHMVEDSLPVLVQTLLY